jgi:hypothetical protein
LMVNNPTNSSFSTGHSPKQLPSSTTIERVFHIVTICIYCIVYCYSIVHDYAN